jgi:nitroimidazol reductase NimA-like FMN-containing flavoprotein (pyridoxamine 5'-phosphate oxidase superfamily)
MAKSNKEIEREILAFLDQHSTRMGPPSMPFCPLLHGTGCAVGTSRDNVPRVIPLDFFNDGLTLWLMCGPGEKVANMRDNPEVSVAIYTPMDHSKEHRSIMLKGKATVFTYGKEKKGFMEAANKFDLLGFFKKATEAAGYSESAGEQFQMKLEEIMGKAAMVKVEPEIITLLVIPPVGQMEKLIWEKEG